MQMRKGQIQKWIAIFVVLLIVVLLYPGLRFQAGSYLNRFIPVPYYNSDEQLVEKAVDVIAGRDDDLDRIQTIKYPVVVDLPEMKCVGFNPRRGTYGVTETVCFSKADGSTVVHHVGD
jgi:hypothetical protein